MAKMWRRRMGGIILCSMACTTVMLAVQGRIREAIPLHLCSVSALAAAVLAFMPVQPIVDYLWLLGMPGAILALVFPAPAVSRWQTLFTACYMLTHALIVLIGLSAMAMGECPRAGKAPMALIFLQALALTAFFVNRALGTDFLFLSAPPIGTPLVWIGSAGYGAYIACLQGMMTLRGAAALRREVSTRRFFCYTKIKKCCIIKQNIGHIARFSDLPGMSARFSVSK